MKLGVYLGYWIPGQTPDDQLAVVVEAERLGYDSVWAAEAYGSDAATVLAWLAAGTSKIKLGSAIFQMPARSAAMTAMTAATIDHLGRPDDARDRILGPAGRRGLARPAVRAPAPADARVRRVSCAWRWRASGSTSRARRSSCPLPDGPGKALKLMIAPGAGADPDLPGGDRTQEHRSWPARSPTAGSRPSSRPSTSPSVRALLEEGAREPGRSLDGFDIAPTVNAYVSDDSELARNLMRPVLALYIGGMGSRKQNFYNQLVQRYGFEDAAAEIQDLYLDGKKEEAAAAIPDELIDLVSLCGPREARA